MGIITIVGAGMMGTAMCWPASDNHHEVRLVGTPLDEEIITSIRSAHYHPRLQRQVPEGVVAYASHQMPQALLGADMVISGVSSFGVPWFAEVVGLLLSPHIPVLAVTKGLEDQENGDLLTLPEATKRRLPIDIQNVISLNAIAGPCIAHELAARRDTCVVFTGSELDRILHLRDLLQTQYYRIWPSTDVIGVETCAALKNAYALGVGLAVGMMEQSGPDGLAQMYNPQAALFAQSILEMRRFLKLLGGGDANISWLPGVGDLYVTVFGGRTVRLGKLLGRGVKFQEARQVMAGETLESVEIITRVGRAIPKLEARGLVKPASFPLLMFLYQMIHLEQPLCIPWHLFFNATE